MANLYSDSSKTNLLSSKSANVSLTGLVYGLDYTPTSNVTASGYSAQTATAQATATYKAGNFSWSSAVVSGSPVVTKANGTPNSNPATITISTQQSVIGSNTAVVSIYPSISYGSIIVTRPNQNVVVTANVMSTAGTIIGPTSNNQYANDGPLTSSVNLQLSPAAPSGIDARWSLQNLSGPASSITAAGDGQSANVYFAVAANTFAYSTSVSNVIVGLYDSSSNTLLSTRSIQTSLKVGTYGLTITQIPVNNVQSGYTAQTSIATLSASIKAGGFVFSSSNTSGVAPTFSPSGTTSNGTYTTGTGIWSLNTNGVTTNTTIESWSLILYDASNSSGGNQIISTPANTFTLTAQQNSYTFSLSGSTTNTQILGSTTSNVSTIITGSHDISGGTMSGWTTSNTTSGYYLTSNTTSAVVGYSTTVSQSAAVAYYTTTLTGTLLDANNRFVQTLSVPVVLRSYFPNVTLAFSSNNVVASGYTAQAASATVTSTCWIGATGFSLNHNLVSGGDFGYTAGTQNTSYQQWSYVTGNGSSPGTSFGVVNFQPSVTFYEKTSNNVTWSANGSLTANFYNPAVSLAVANNGVGGFVPPVTAYAVVTASSNVSGATYTWSSPQGVGGNGFTGTYTQSTNTQFVVLGDVERHLLERVLVPDPVDHRDDQVQPGLQRLVELAQALDHPGLLLRNDPDALEHHHRGEREHEERDREHAGRGDRRDHDRQHHDDDELGKHADLLRRARRRGRRPGRPRDGSVAFAAGPRILAPAPEQELRDHFGQVGRALGVGHQAFLGATVRVLPRTARMTKISPGSPRHSPSMCASQSASRYFTRAIPVARSTQESSVTAWPRSSGGIGARLRPCQRWTQAMPAAAATTAIATSAQNGVPAYAIVREVVFGQGGLAEGLA